ncbi:MAG: hypothetical protein EPN21_19930 [Methylococcaceae bacterium]|nr:MAG: hypothetical protein EPN21_19930 [Methylococcaceae bacterium]
MSAKFQALAIAGFIALSAAYAEASEETVHSERLPAVDAVQSPPVRDIAPADAEQDRDQPHVVPLRKREPSPATSAPLSKPPQDPLAPMQRKVPLTPLGSPLISFEGLSGKNNETAFGSPSSPADVNGDVGPNHYVQMVNNLWRVFDKQTGQPLTAPLKLSALFKAGGVTGSCAKQDQGDPIVLYDPLADRWLLSQFNFDTAWNGNDKPPYHECVAISASADPTGVYYLYDFIMEKNRFNDYPKFGVWPDGYYLTVSQYGPNGGDFVGQALYVFDRAGMLAGQSAAANYHDFSDMYELSILLPADLDGPPPPAGTPNYVVGFNTNYYSGLPIPKLRVFEIYADFASTSPSVYERAESPLSLATFNAKICSNSAGNCIPQRGVGQKLDALTDRPLHRLQYRYFADSCPVDASLSACGTLTFNHSVNSGNSKTGVRWYIATINPSTDALRIAQQGTFGTTDNSRWMGSVALNKNGDLAAGYSISGPNVFPSIRYSGRLAGDTPNILTLGEGVLQNGTAPQTGGSERWGDYSMMAVDPVDDCTFWYTNQYYSTKSDGYNWYWKTRIGSFRLADNC